MIDWERVEELRGEFGFDEFCEVVQLFLDEVEESLERLRQPQSEARRAEEFHFLKGSALNLGFAELGRLCAEGESRCADSGAPFDTGALVDCYFRSRLAFRSTVCMARCDCPARIQATCLHAPIRSETPRESRRP